MQALRPGSTWRREDADLPPVTQPDPVRCPACGQWVLPDEQTMCLGCGRSTLLPVDAPSDGRRVRLADEAPT